MKNQDILQKCLRDALLDRTFTGLDGISRSDMRALTESAEFGVMATELLLRSGSHRFRSQDVLAICSNYFPELQTIPEEGWLEHTRLYILNSLFPHLNGPKEAEVYQVGRSILLQLLRGVYEFERETMAFDPTRDMHLLTDAEINENGYTSEYIRMHRLARSKFIYEFMRIGVDTTPFNTLGHVGGVHYVAMFVARQLIRAGVPVDLGLISGAAASHDIGKYGCRKEEERRVPYLHYYYTDYCLSRHGLKAITHIAANHSTWDLELENLSAESLLLIYADFRVKSSRNADGEEIVYFYTLEQAFEVILNKLDNVDEAKRQRYVRVYNKLKDFEDFMIENGVLTDLPEDFAEVPAEFGQPIHRETALLHGQDVVDQIKFRAVDHNIRLMNRFNDPTSFGDLIEAARSETQWKNIRTYISILGEYSMYMTLEQKTTTLHFLYETLTNKESDIREQAAFIMGRMVATFRENYKKELPASVPPPDTTATNIYTFETFLDLLFEPDHKLTPQHQIWITAQADFFVQAAVQHCKPVYVDLYFKVFEKYFQVENCDHHRAIVLCSTLLRIDPAIVPEFFRQTILGFARDMIGYYRTDADLIALAVIRRYISDEEAAEFLGYDPCSKRLELLGLTGSTQASELLPTLFLDDLKVNTSWIVKAANIHYMMDQLDLMDGSSMLHVATHLANLVKVSETVTVRHLAGRSLLSMLDRMPLDQINELVIELFNGLELGDYQFSRFIPDVLGKLLLYLPAEELDEVLYELEKIINSENEKAASAALNTIAVTLAYYDEYACEDSPEAIEKRRLHLLGLQLKGLAHYKDSISQEAFRTIGVRLFASDHLTDTGKAYFVTHAFKRILSLIPERGEDHGLDFYNNAAVLNMLYRFVSSYQSDIGAFDVIDPKKAAFFPGTFDPFSLGHKAIATTIRDLGYEVYLALDEFSWSKKTLPHMLRRKILAMSIADEEGLFIFPDDVSVNIANPQDLRELKELFQGRELAMAMGSDVVKNASSYRKAPEADSIHSMNHIIFERVSRNEDEIQHEEYPITGKVTNLKLRKYYEDISSTRIRENIDLGRDIASLLDPIAQNYIYDRNFYSREPAYKHVLQARELEISSYEHMEGDFLEELRSALEKRRYDTGRLRAYIEQPKVKTIHVTTGNRRRKISAFACARRMETQDLLDEFGNREIASTIRRSAQGGIAVIGAIFTDKTSRIANISQIILTELLTSLLAKDYAYAVYHPVDPAGMNASTIDSLKEVGFVNISTDRDHPIYAVNMKAPIVVFRDVETVIKAPLNKNPRVLKALDDAHHRLIRTFSEMYPGQLVISFDTSAVFSKITNLVAAENHVSTTPDPERRRGPYMSVPFGKALADVVVPNTVTKALRTEKYFKSDLSGFTIREAQNYSPLQNQARTIRSFARPVILIDDLLHSGQRMKQLDPILRDADVDVRKTIVGLLTGNARDDMKERGRNVEGAYFIPTISMWLNERDCYPFIGGDSIDLPDLADPDRAGSSIGAQAQSHNGKANVSSINLILPYTSFNFVGGDNAENIYKYSMTCLENACEILKVLEQEYQRTFEKKLTLRRLGAVITAPCRPLRSTGLSYDETLAPSTYVEDDIRQAKRLHLLRL